VNKKPDNGRASPPPLHDQIANFTNQVCMRCKRASTRPVSKIMSCSRTHRFRHTEVRKCASPSINFNYRRALEFASTDPLAYKSPHSRYIPLHSKFVEVWTGRRKSAVCNKWRETQSCLLLNIVPVHKRSIQR
jgi:hypothetical protein